MTRLAAIALSFALCLVAAGCGSSYNSGIDGQVQHLESGRRTTTRPAPGNRTLEVVKQINVITDGVTSADRASRVRMFDR